MTEDWTEVRSSHSRTISSVQSPHIQHGLVLVAVLVLLLRVQRLDWTRLCTSNCDAEWSTIVCATSSDDGGNPSISFWVCQIGVQRRSSIKHSEPTAENRRCNSHTTAPTTIRLMVEQLLDLLLRTVMHQENQLLQNFNNVCYSDNS